MLKDAQELDVATDSTTAIAAIDRFTDQVLSYGTDASAIFKGIAADPQCVQGNLLAAVLQLFLETRAAAAAAKPYIEAAGTRAASATPREQLALQAVTAWALGRGDGAGPLFEEIVGRWPRDLLAAKLAQYHYFNAGDRVSFLRVAELAFAANRENPYAHGMLAFALEMNGRLAEAEAAGRAAVNMQRAEPWAQHAVAHVLQAQGRIAEGVAWLEELAPTWSGCNSFMLTHNWWHLALFKLDGDQPDAALALYDDRIWGVWKDYSQDQINAVSLLWRLELRGIDVGDRWQDLADHIARRSPEHVQPLLDLHYGHALARAGRDGELAVLLASLEKHCRDQPEQPVWCEVVLPAVKAAIALARQDAPSAATDFGRILDRAQELGGGRAQRDLLTQSWLYACLHSDQARAALPLLEQRAAGRPSVPCHRRQLAQALRLLGDAEGAGRETARAQALAVQ